MNLPAQFNRFRVSVFFALFFGFIAVFAPFSTFAATDNQTSGGVVIPQIASENLKVASSLSPGSAVPLTFTINNVENRAHYDVGYRVKLVGSERDLYFQQDFPKLYTFEPFQKRDVEATINLPQNIPSGDYFLQVNAITPKGSDLSDIQTKVNIHGSGPSIVTFGKISVSSGAQRSPVASGIIVDPGDTIIADVELNSTKKFTSKQKYIIYSGKDFSTGIAGEGETRTIEAGFNKFNFSFKNTDTRSSFTLLFWFEDEQGLQVSPMEKIGWGVWGGTPGLNYITADKLKAGKGEIVDVEIAFTPSVSRESIGETTVKVWVEESYAEKKLDFLQGSVVLVPVTLVEAVDDPAIRVEIEKNGSTLLDYRTSNPNGLTNKKTDKLSDELNNSNELYLGFSVFFAILLLIIFFYKKKHQNITKIAVFFIFGSLSIFFLQKDSLASFDHDGGWTSTVLLSCSNVDSNFQVNFDVYRNGSVTIAPQNSLFRPGDTIRFDGSVEDGSGCSISSDGRASHNVGTTEIGVTRATNWDESFIIPDSLDNIARKNTYVKDEWSGEITSSGTPSQIYVYRTMTITMGPRQIDGTTLSTNLPACTNSNYNTTFNLTGRALAENYRIEWATNSGFTTGTGNQVFASSGAGAKSFTTTGTPFDRTQTYYWRVVAYNSNAGSEITTTASAPFGPVNTCPVAPTNGSVTSAPSCVKNDGATYYTFTTTYNDANGAADISQAYILINSTTSQNAGTAPVGALALYMTPSDGSVYIRNATDISWSPSATGNTYAGINRAAFTRSLSGNTVTVNWSIRFFSTWVGESANIYLRTIDSGGLDTGYEDKGDLAIPCPVPANPTNLTVSTGCNASNSEVTFTFTDNANNEDIYWLDVNSAAWTGTGTPSPWGVKTFNRSAAERTATGNVTWIWRSTDALSGTPTAPVNNTTYWWRVKANNTNGDSAHVYPANTLTPPGASFTTPNCVVPAPIVPTPSGVSNLPSCVNPGQTFGPAIVLNWNTVANATSYTARLTVNVNTGGDFSTKTVATNSASGTGGWGNPNANPLVTWLSGSNLALSANVTYFYAVSAAGPGGDSGYDLSGKSMQFGPIPECPPSNASNLNAVAGCDAQGRPQVTFTFTDTSSNEDRFWLDVNGAAWTGSGAPSPWALETINRSAGEKSGTGVVTFVWSTTNTLDSGDVDPVLAGTQLIPAQGKTYWWRVKANSTTAGDSAHVYPTNSLAPPGVSVTVANCVPTAPGNLSASPSCVTANAQILFRFQDLSATEDQFIIEVNDRAWDGTGTGPTPFGVKAIARTGGAKTGSGSFVNYIWSVTNPLDSGDTNSTLAGAQLTPAQGKTYYWRMRTREGASNDSANVYPNGGAGTLTPPGVSVVTPNCSPADLEVSFVPGTWKDSVGVNPAPLMQFEPNERVTVDVQVKNLGGVNSPATDLYVFYKNLGNQMPDCSLATPRAITTAPLDSTGGTQGYAVPALSGGASSPPISVSLTIDAVAGSVYAYAVPKCEFDASPWGNNVASQTYIVDADGFIETRGGDVGAVGDISVSVKSKNLATPIYQGDYIINANTMNANVDSKNNWILKGYAAKQVPTGGLYNYFDAKYKGKATEQTAGNCTFTGSEVFVNCKGNLTFGGAEVAPGISRVFFVEQDLRFQKNFVLGTNASVLFIVKGNVNVDLAVNRIDGVFVVKGTFDDSDVADAGVASAGDALTVNGAVYVESATGLSLTRYFTTPINKTTPANKFIWDPKFMIQLSQLVGTRPIIWKEVAP